ncbi:MAG: pyridoxamine 5'-phosphate oxidase family protein [Spirochaetaceae bacterium]|nr:pyridoxamine 5'-phosphate oxidase family protein [Myxococcales bacterium]MCB9724447.1 pyridoxamine 5'-phosphate oxidase family protein [Spirochaetaceae bacterium]
MPSRRDLIAMTEDEMWAFIETQRSIQVCTLNKDGTPHLTVMWFAVVDGAIVLETFTKAQKIVNLKRDPRMAVLLEDGEQYNELRGVSINCQAELVEDYDTVHALHVEVVVRNTPGVTREQAAEFTREMCKKKTVIRVRPQKVMSWDHRKLDVAY